MALLNNVCDGISMRIVNDQPATAAIKHILMFNHPLIRTNFNWTKFVLNRTYKLTRYWVVLLMCYV